MDITGVQLALYLTLLSSAMLLSAWAVVRQVLVGIRRSQVRAVIEPYRAEGRAMLPESQRFTMGEARRAAATRDSPGLVVPPRRSAGGLKIR